MYDASYVGLIQIFDIKKNNDYAMWLQVCKKTNCLLLCEGFASYPCKRSGSISNHSYRALVSGITGCFERPKNKIRCMLPAAPAGISFSA